VERAGEEEIASEKTQGEKRNEEESSHNTQHKQGTLALSGPHPKRK
jgi:hypothetical protein